MRKATTLFAIIWSIVIAACYARKQNTRISDDVFETLEELARVVDISYCVGTTGIQKPFNCLSRCRDFRPGVELIATWYTGPFLSDSCGYIAISQAPFDERILVVFRGTYSIANTIADLSTLPAKYVPYPADGSDRCGTESSLGPGLTRYDSKRPVCDNCTVHLGFLTSWENTRCDIIPQIEQLLVMYPNHKLVLVGHSLGGAVAALAALELEVRGHTTYVTTFGEPRLGNRQLREYINQVFELEGDDQEAYRYRRVTHRDDLVPLLPVMGSEFAMHAGEVFISKSSLPPERHDIHYCTGNEDESCIAGTQVSLTTGADHEVQAQIPDTFGPQNLLFAHRDYFWRLGLCLPSSDGWTVQEL